MVTLSKTLPLQSHYCSSLTLWLKLMPVVQIRSMLGKVGLISCDKCSFTAAEEKTKQPLWKQDRLDQLVFLAVLVLILLRRSDLSAHRSTALCFQHMFSAGRSCSLQHQHADDATPNRQVKLQTHTHLHLVTSSRTSCRCPAGLMLLL